MTDLTTSSVSETDEAKAFLEFEYVEVKDLTKHFLTVVAGVLAVTVTFAKDIISFTDASAFQKALMMMTWGCGLVAFFLGGFAICWIYSAGIGAKHTALYGILHPYRRRTSLAYICIDVGGMLFVIALALLVVGGAVRLLK
jgi:hypothetical protein